jgi:hypothetical protein
VEVSLKVGLSRRKAEHEVSDHKGIFDEFYTIFIIEDITLRMIYLFKIVARQ